MKLERSISYAGCTFGNFHLAEIFPSSIRLKATHLGDNELIILASNVPFQYNLRICRVYIIRKGGLTLS